MHLEKIILLTKFKHFGLQLKLKKCFFCQFSNYEKVKQWPKVLHLLFLFKIQLCKYDGNEKLISNK